MSKQLNKQIVFTLMGMGVVIGTSVSYAQSETSRPDLNTEQPCADDGQRRGFKKPRFADLDLDGDSFVTLAEFKEKPIPHGDHETVFGHIDADGNGEITQNEFESHRPPPRPRRQAQSGRSRG